MQHYPGLRSLKRSIRITEVIGLSLVALATIIAGGQELIAMFHRREVTLGDLLLMFLYLEVLAMTAVYLDSGKLPIRFPLYIAIIALARYLILDMKSLDLWELIAVGFTMLLIAFAVLVIRFGHLKYPYPESIQLEKNLLAEKKSAEQD